jgi:hypothetical protein
MLEQLMDITIPRIGDTNFNFTYVQHHFIEWSTQGYWLVFGFMFLPIFYMGIVGFVYTRMKSATAAVVAILIIVSAMGDAFFGVPLLLSILQIFVALVMSVLVVVLLTRIRS